MKLLPCVRCRVTNRLPMDTHWTCFGCRGQVTECSPSDTCDECKDWSVATWCQFLRGNDASLARFFNPVAREVANSFGNSPAGDTGDDMSPLHCAQKSCDGNTGTVFSEQDMETEPNTSTAVEAAGFEGTKWENSPVSGQLHVCASGREYFKWTRIQTDATDNYFQSYLHGDNRGKIPGKMECLLAQKKFPALSEIPWAKIKHKVYNSQMALKRKPNTPKASGLIDGSPQDVLPGASKPPLVRPYSRTPWSADELDAIKEGFFEYFTDDLEVHPGKDECELIMADYPMLQARGWKLVKHCVINLQKKCHKHGSDRVL